MPEKFETHGETRLTHSHTHRQTDTHTHTHTHTHTGKQGMGTRSSDLENFSQFLRLFHGSIDSHIHPHTHTLMHKHTHTHTHSHTGTHNHHIIFLDFLGNVREWPQLS